jgi:hypothetical protein
MLTSSLRGTGRAAALVLSTLWLLGASCELASEAAADIDAGEASTVVATAGCDVQAIVDRGDGVTCATCVADDGDTEICGLVDVARCESREDSRGEPCSYCATEFGEILFDSCFSDDPIAFVQCESSEGPERPKSGEEQFLCETCTDADGVVVARSCEPRSDECHIEDDSGVSCRVCTRDGDVVVRNCRQPDIAPRSCEAYGDVNVVGRCIDCYGDDDELLSHTCTLAEDPFVSCSESVTPEGLRCLSCFDANGAQVERSCGAIQPDELRQCALLDYSEQSCVVCLNARGEPQLLECDRTTCAEATDCPPPPECTFELGGGGELCRTCPTDAGELEQVCVVETNLVCAGIEAEREASCLSCSDLDTGVEVYRRCDDQASAPPTCFFFETDDGQECEVCTDPESNDVTYANCPTQTCYEVGDFTLLAADGNTALQFDNAPAVASCDECAMTASDPSTEGGEFQALCALRPDCPIDLTSPDAACEGTVAFRVTPRFCENPWENAGFPSTAPGGVDELLHMLSFALQANLALVAVQSAPSFAPPTCEDACACERGDVMEIVARPEDAALVVELFGSVIDRCADEGDCRAGDVCRTDGACG